MAQRHKVFIRVFGPLWPNFAEFSPKLAFEIGLHTDSATKAQRHKVFIRVFGRLWPNFAEFSHKLAFEIGPHTDSATKAQRHKVFLRVFGPLWPKNICTHIHLYSRSKYWLTAS